MTDLIRALAVHSWFLLTFRHDGTGLPRKSLSLLLFLFGIAASFAAVRFGQPPYLFVMFSTFIVLCFVALFSGPEFAAGAALVSIAIDTFVMVLQLPAMISSVWELAAYIALFVRIVGKRKRSGS